MTTALVVTTIHQADDPRIRERTIGSLSRDFDVVYAAKLPEPSRTDDIEFVALRGGRIRRWFGAFRLMASRRFSPPGVRRSAMPCHRASRTTPRMAAAAHPFGAGGFGPWTASGALTVVRDTLRGALLATARNRSVRMRP